ncbi:MAG: DUF1275 domain-containing protein [Oscillospiraceae bacterium]|nr:DUF1275 domain-containing protein [Oscillospiraceae bacterium]
MKNEAAPVKAAGRDHYLACEKRQIYALLMMAGGYLGAFTYSIRGGVFCNAQTGNFVLMAMALGGGAWAQALYYLIPISAYCLGAVVSEAAEAGMGKLHLIRWETALVLVEMLAVLFLGFLPEAAPVQITQITVNFICSMQYNTFRQAQGIPMATTFCTNHIRQVGIGFYRMLADRDKKREARRKLSAHLGMLAAFVAGGALSAFFCGRLLGKAVWFAELPLGVVLADLLRADLGKERGELEQIPRGH